MATPLEARTVPDIVTSSPARRPARTSSSTTRGRRPACRAPTRSCPSAATAAPSRTSTATCSSTSPPASPSTRRATATRRRRGDRGPGRQAAPLLRQRLLPADLRPRPPPSSPASRRWPARPRVPRQLRRRGRRGRLKLARYPPGGQYVVAFLGAFHGRTMGAVSLTASKAKYHARFGPLLPGVYHVPFGSRGPRRDRAAHLQAPVPADEFAADHRRAHPGRGRLRRPRRRLPAALRELCDRHGILLVADEVQSGAGRTGKMWAHPALGRRARHPAHRQGHRLGHAARRDDRQGRPDDLGTRRPRLTYGGNPVACAAALETVRLLEDGLIENAADRGARDPGRAPAADPAPPRRSSRTSAARAS